MHSSNISKGTRKILSINNFKCKFIEVSVEENIEYPKNVCIYIPFLGNESKKIHDNETRNVHLFFKSKTKQRNQIK